MLNKILKKRIVSAGLLMVVLIFLLGCAAQTESSESQEIKYTMYVGLNDKNTYTQLISDDEASKKVSEIAMKYVDGFTQLPVKGAYKDDKGIITYEKSLVFEFYNATEQQMKAIMDEVLKALNQSSILIVKQRVNYEFYEGVEK